MRPLTAHASDPIRDHTDQTGAFGQSSDVCNRVGKRNQCTRVIVHFVRREATLMIVAIHEPITMMDAGLVLTLSSTLPSSTIFGLCP